MFIILIW